MNSEYRNELIEKFKELSLLELLNLLLVEDNVETKKVIKSFISENYTENPALELEKALKEIEMMNYSQDIKEKLTIAKQCVMDIKDNLEIEHVNSLTEITVLVSELVKKSTFLLEV